MERRSYRKINRLGLDGYELLVHLDGVDASALLGTVLREEDAREWAAAPALVEACDGGATALQTIANRFDKDGDGVGRNLALTWKDSLRSALALAKGKD